MAINRVLGRFPPPESPGVYLMKDSAGKTIYIGKAKNLADRVPTYFSGKLKEDPKTRLLVSKVRSIEYIIVKNEVSALLLEAQLIRDVRPKFNIDLKEGVRYAYLKITDNEQYPKILVTRKVTPGGTYFGPYTSGSSRMKALALLRRVFGIRACKCRGATKFCMKYHIFNPEGKPIDRGPYLKNVERVKGVLSGKNVAGIRRQLVSEMESASQMQRYELARLIRDQIRAIDELSKPQSIEAANVVGNRDFVAFSKGKMGLMAVVLKVRRGVLLKKEKYDGLDDELGFLALYYSLPDGMPDEIVAAGVGEEKLSLFRAATSELLAGQGRKVRIVSHSTDDAGRELEETARRNAEFEALGRASPALSELMDALSLKGQPRVIEGFDISNLGPSGAVGSMVQFVDGRPNRSGYRLFKIRTVLGQNDFAMMAEVVGRRYSKEKLPDLILLDGGAGQLSAVIRVLAALGMKDAKLAALAKENEELRTPGRRGVLALQKSSPALKLLMHVRDEAHRFALSYQKKLRKIEQNL